MKCYLYVEDNIGYWSEESVVRRNCKSQHDVMMFDPDSHTYCCEMTPSFCMEPAYGTFRPKVEDSDDPTSVFYDSALLEEIDDDIAMTISPEVKYYHSNRILGLPHFKENEIPDELPPAFVIVDDTDHEDVEDLEEFLGDVRGNPAV